MYHLYKFHSHQLKTSYKFTHFLFLFFSFSFVNIKKIPFSSFSFLYFLLFLCSRRVTVAGLSAALVVVVRQSFFNVILVFLLIQHNFYVKILLTQYVKVSVEQIFQHIHLYRQYQLIYHQI